MSSLAKKAVGRSIKVYWPNDNDWYPGVVLNIIKNSIVHVLYDDGEEEEVDLSDEQFVLGNPADTEAIASVSAALSESQDASVSASLVDTLRAKGIDPVKALTGTLTLSDGDDEGQSATLDTDGSTEEDSEDSDSDDGSSGEDSDESDEDSARRRRRRQRKKQREAEKTEEQDIRVTVKFVFGGNIRRRELPISQDYQKLVEELNVEFGEPFTLEYVDDEEDTVTIATQNDLEAALRYQAGRQYANSAILHTVSLGQSVTPTASSGLGASTTLSGAPGSLRIVVRRPGEGVTRSLSVGELPKPKQHSTSAASTPTIPEESSKDLDDSSAVSASRGPTPGAQQKAPLVLQDFDLTMGGGGGGGSSPSHTHEWSATASPASAPRSPRWRNHNSESKFSASNPLPSALPHKVTAWKRGSLIGNGSFGRVYVALDQNTGTQIAVKCVNFGEDAKSKQEVAALKREIDLLSGLNHPNIIQYLGTATRGRKLYIFLEYASGGSVMSAIKRFGKLSEAIIRRYTKQILEGLAYLHRNKIIHRDIKGQNILLDRGTIKLADFGCSKQMSTVAHSEAPQTAVGTTQFMAPEIMKADAVYGRKADIWSVGMTVIEMATGKPPWANPAHAVYKICMTEDLPAMPDHLSTAAVDFLKQCLQRDPSLRPDAAELLQHPFITEPLEADNMDDNSLDESESLFGAPREGGDTSSDDQLFPTGAQTMQPATGASDMFDSTLQ